MSVYVIGKIRRSIHNTFKKIYLIANLLASAIIFPIEDEPSQSPLPRQHFFNLTIMHRVLPSSFQLDEEYFATVKDDYEPFEEKNMWV